MDASSLGAVRAANSPSAPDGAKQLFVPIVLAMPSGARWYNNVPILALSVHMSCLVSVAMWAGLQPGQCLLGHR